MWLDGEDASEQHVRDRQVGFVFQHYALFRHMTVFENVAFGLRVKPRRQRPPEREIARRVHELLGLSGHEWQSLYHFSMGVPIEDTRLTTEPGYPWETSGSGLPAPGSRPALRP